MRYPDFAQRFKTAVAECDTAPKTQADLGKWLGFSQPTINCWYRGEKIPSMSSAIKVCGKLGVNTEWLLSGKGSKRTHDSAGVLIGAGSNLEPAPDLGAFSKVPVVGSAQLGDNGYWSELEYPVGHGDGYVSHATKDNNAYALRCVGDSMKPRIKSGEFVVIEPNHTPIPGDEIMLKTHDGRVMVKTLLYERDGKVHVMSINESHPPQSFDMAEIDKIHYVAAIVKTALWAEI
jgi:phage repressor protein C with HTH and peptisase S24 domain